MEPLKEIMRSSSSPLMMDNVRRKSILMECLAPPISLHSISHLSGGISFRYLFTSSVLTARCMRDDINCMYK